jgi:hypothetical protein
VLAGYCVVAVISRARVLMLGAGEHGEAPPRESVVKSAALAATVGLLTLPVLVPAVQLFWARHVRKSMVTEADRPLLRDRQALVQWLRHELPKDGFYRVGVFMGHNHELMDLGAEIDRPIYKRGFTPASDFVYQMNEQMPELLQAINLRFAISKVYLPPVDFESLATFGAYTVYRFKRWQPDPFEVIEGRGPVKLERFGNREIVLRAAAGASGKLRLNVSYFSRWHAYRDGKPVPLTITYLREAPETTGFMTVKLQPGRYRFAFEPTLADSAAVPLGLFGVLLCGVLALADRRPRELGLLRRALDAVCDRLDRLSEPSFATARTALCWLVAAILLALGIGLARWRPLLEPQELGALAVRKLRYDFLEELSEASARIDYRGVSQPCLRQGDHLVCRDEEGNLDYERYIASSPATIKEYTMVRCIRARPEKDALLTITYPDVPIGQSIIGYYGIERAGRMMYKRRPVELHVKVADQPVYDGKTQSDNKMHWFEAKLGEVKRQRARVTFSVRADNVSRRYFCFYAQMVDLK